MGQVHNFTPKTEKCPMARTVLQNSKNQATLNGSVKSSNRSPTIPVGHLLGILQVISKAPPGVSRIKGTWSQNYWEQGNKGKKDCVCDFFSRKHAGNTKIKKILLGNKGTQGKFCWDGFKRTWTPPPWEALISFHGGPFASKAYLRIGHLYIIQKSTKSTESVQQFV